MRTSRTKGILFVSLEIEWTLPQPTPDTPPLAQTAVDPPVEMLQPFTNQCCVGPCAASTAKSSLPTRGISRHQPACWKLLTFLGDLLLRRGNPPLPGAVLAPRNRSRLDANRGITPALCLHHADHMLHGASWGSPNFRARRTRSSQSHSHSRNYVKYDSLGLAKRARSPPSP